MPYLEEGYAAGKFIGSGRWLTIPGSAYLNSSDLVHATAEQAAKWAEQAAKWAEQFERTDLLVKRVRRVDHPGVTVTHEAFLVLDEEPSDA